MREQRRSRRVQLAIKAIVQHGDRILVCHSGNLSAGGMLVYSPVPLGGAVRVSLTLPGESQRLRLLGRVVREAREEGRMAFGVEFSSLVPQVDAALRRFTEGGERPRPPTVAAGRQRRDPTLRRDPSRATPSDLSELAQLYRAAIAEVDAFTGGRKPMRYQFKRRSS